MSDTRKRKKVRTRQIIRAIEMKQRPDTIASYRGEDGHKRIVFIPAGHEEEYKERYGDSLRIWF